MGVLIAIVAILGGCFVAIVNRVLAHREKMAEIEARRPRVVLQIPESSLAVPSDDMTERILEACRAKGIDADQLDLEVEAPRQLRP
ncbi:MAG: hypothetical protein H6710_04680 [Myxococcales bacterium]|nr:hypothetical protein [Myxococcales bacterium]